MLYKGLFFYLIVKGLNYVLRSNISKYRGVMYLLREFYIILKTIFTDVFVAVVLGLVAECYKVLVSIFGRYW